MEQPGVKSQWSISDLSTFFVRHRESLLNQASRALGDRGLAEEVVQDSLVKVILASPELNSEDHTLAYFRVTVRNLSIDLMRQKGLRPRLVALDEVSVQTERDHLSSPDLAEVIERADDAVLVREALSLLSPAERAALVLWELEGRSAGEIARELGIKTSSVRHTVARARTSLRRVLANRIIDTDRGLTALDLLSDSYRLARKVVRNSGRIALSLVLLMASFVGLNSLNLNQTSSGTSGSTPDSARGSNRDLIPNGFGSEIRGRSSGSREKTLVEGKQVSPSGKALKSSDSLSLSSSQSNFLGLDSEGIPTGFTVADSAGKIGALFLGGDRNPILTESGLMLSNIASTRSGAASVLLDQAVVVDPFGTSYTAQVSVGISGVWHPLTLSSISSEVERLPSGQYLLSAMMMVESALDPAVELPTGNPNEDLLKAPTRVLVRILLNSSKTVILGQAVMVSADSQADKA